MRLAPGRMTLFIKTLLTFCVLLMTGCGEPHYANGTSPYPEQERVESPVPETSDNLAELSRRLGERSESEIQQLADLLEFDSASAGLTSSHLEGTPRTIADQLLTLTLEEADRLGALLAEQGVPTELPMLIADRQTRARTAVEDIQKRLTKLPEGYREYDIFIADPLVVEKLDLPWLEARTGRQYEQVTGLSFAREEYDLGTTETDVSDDEMKYVGMLTGLRRLDIQNSQVTGRGLYAMRYLQRLETLDARWIKATLPQWRTLAKLTGLRKLKLQPVKPDVADCGWAGQLPHLEELDAYELILDETELDGLCRSRSLRTLHLGGETPDHTVVIERLPSLEELHLSLGNKYDDATARVKLAGLPKLENLHAHISRRSPDDHFSLLAPLEQLELTGLPQLNSVYLTAGQLPPNGMAPLKRSPSLKYLMLVGMTVPGETFHWLEELEELIAVNCRTDDGDRALQSLSKIESLTHIRLLAEEVSATGLHAASSLPRLKTLELSDLEASRDVSSHIMRMATLEELSLGGTSVPEIRLANHETLRSVGLHALRTDRVTLENLPNLRRFEFNRGEFSQIELRKLPELSWCDLSTVSPERVQSLQLADLPHLSHFQLGPTSTGGSIEAPSEPIPLGDDFIAQFKPMEHLKMLWLRNVLVTDAGLLQLGHLLQLGSREFSGPHVTAEGQARLKEAIEEGRRQARAQRDAGR